jgi:hypothetical protein
MSIPYRIGRPTPDGGLHLNEAEREWLAEVIRRTDTASAEISVDSGRPPPADYVLRYIAGGLADIIAPFAAVEAIPQTQEDEWRRVQRRRAQITIIRGGLPPRPAF